MIKQVLRIRTIMLLAMMISAAMVWGCSENKDEKANESFQAGLAAIQAGQTDDAKIHFKKTLQNNPQHAKAHYHLGSIYAQSKQEDEIKLAIRHLRLAFQLDDTLDEARRELAILGFKVRAYKEIIDICKKYLEKNPDDLEISLILAKSLLNVKNPDEASPILQKLAEKHPKDAEVSLNLGRAYLFTDQPDKARKMFELGVSLAPDDMNAQISLLQFYQSQKLSAEADAALQALKQKFADKPAVYQIAALHYIRNKQLPEAEAVLKQAIEQRNLKKTFLYHDLGFIQHNLKKYNEAMQSFEKAASLDPEDQKSLILLAEYYLKRDKVDQAIATYEKINAKWPEIKPIKSKIAQLLMAQNKDDQAQAYIDQAVQEDPDFAPAQILKALALMKNKQKDDAKAAFTKAYELNPELALGNFYYGLTMLDEKDYAKSRDALQKAVAKKPNAIQFREALAYAYYKTGETESALTEINTVLEKAPNHLRAHLLRGALYVKLKELEKAKKDYQFILEYEPGENENKPDPVLIKFRLAEIEYALGNLDEALQGFEALVDKYPDPEKPEPGKTIARIVRIYLDKQEIQKAIQVCDAQLQKNPEDLTTGVIKALVLNKAEKTADAQKVLSDLTKQHPQALQPLLLMARIQMGDKAFDAALETLQKAIALKPQNAWPYMQTAAIYQRRAMKEKAIETYESLLKAKGSYPPAENDLAYLYAEQNRNLDRALELAENAHEAMPKNPAVADTLGYVHLKKGSLALAKQAFSDAIESFPKQPYFHYHLAMVLQKEGDHEGALAALEKAQELRLPKTEKENLDKMMQALQKAEPSKPDWKEAFADAMQNQEYDDAIRLAKAAREKAPHDAELAAALGQAYSAKGSAPLAKRYFDEAIQITPNEPIFHYYIGMVYYQEQNNAEAIKNLQTAVDKGLSGKALEAAQKALAEMKTEKTE